MGWVKQKKNRHVCKKPRLDELIPPDAGDVWMCDDCGLQWMVCESQKDGLYWLMASGDSAPVVKP